MELHYSELCKRSGGWEETSRKEFAAKKVNCIRKFRSHDISKSFPPPQPGMQQPLNREIISWSWRAESWTFQKFNSIERARCGFPKALGYLRSCACVCAGWNIKCLSPHLQFLEISEIRYRRSRGRNTRSINLLFDNQTLRIGKL